jgi:hypothetical protein
VAREKDSMTYVAVGRNESFYDAFNAEQFTVGDVPVGPTPNLLRTGSPAAGWDYALACAVFIEPGAGGSIDTDAIRIRYDGQDPTSTVGGKIPVGVGYFRIEGVENVQQFKMIRDVGTTVDPVVFLVYEK